MFRKLVSNLSYSPSLIGEVAKLARSLKYEEKLRRTGLLFLAVAMIANIFASLSPPESTNTASNYDMIYGGVASTEILLAHYDKNEANTKDIFKAFGITRNEIAALTPATINSKQDTLLVASRKPLGGVENNTTTVQYATQSNTNTGTLYFSPLRALDTIPQTHLYGSTHEVLQGTSKKLGTFAVVTSSGALAINKIPKSLSDPAKSPLTFSKKAHNDTQNSAAHTVMARASDRITYTLAAKNTSDAADTVTFQEHIDDILEYADIVDTKGGALDLQKKTLSWPERPIEAKKTASQEFTVRLKAHLPATARGTSNPHSYDCLLTNTFGNTTQAAVLCPPAKLIEAVSLEMPSFSAANNILASVVVFFVALYLYLRSLQQKEEVRLIRRDANEGVLL